MVSSILKGTLELMLQFGFLKPTILKPDVDVDVLNTLKNPL